MSPTVGVALLVIAAVVAAFCAVVWMALRSRNMQVWIGSYLRRRPRPTVKGPTHIMFCFVDHYEPAWGRVDIGTQRARVDRWYRDYPAMASRHRDADGRPPQHSFFYPEEEYLPEHLDKIAGLCADGYGEIEIHLHHDNDTPENFCATIRRP